MDRIETAARAMCLADDKDPDSPVGVGSETMVPQWTRYEHQARKLVAAQEVIMQGMPRAENSGDKQP